MTQPYNRLHVQHLDVYYPTEKEQKDPKLYATNVRTVMSNQLGVQVYDLTYSDKLEYERYIKELRNHRKLHKKKIVSSCQQEQEQIPPPPSSSSSLPVFTHDPFGNRIMNAADSSLNIGREETRNDSNHKKDK